MSATIFQNLNYQEKKKILLVGLFALVLISTWILLSPSGGLKFYSVNQELESIESQNKSLRIDNKKLSSEIHRLKYDSDYIEQVAREKGLLKRDEMVFVFK